MIKPTMKICTFLLAAGLMIATAGVKAQSVIPIPLRMEQGSGTFLFTGDTKLYTNLKGEEKKMLMDYLETLPIHFKNGKKQTKDNVVSLMITKANPQLSSPESYTLEVTPHKITVQATSGAGLFYGVQTLLQMAQPAMEGAWSVQATTIQDSPRFEYRGLMLDVSRHFRSKEFVKKQIDALAYYKLNRLHLHLTDAAGWRIEIKKYPELTKIGSQRKQTVIGKNTGKYDGTPYGPYFFTQEEIKDVIQYAADRYITIIPEIELPGHALAALATYPELGCTGGPYEVCQMWGVFPEVFCPGNEKTFEFWEGVLDEVAELFPGEIIHIGGDECPRDAWKKCKKCQARMKQENMKEEGELQDYTVHRIEGYLKEKGKRIIGWDEILEGDVSKTAIVMSWRGKTGGIQGAKRGNEVVMVPNDYAYFDYYQSKDVDKEPFSIGGFVDVAKVYSLDPTEGLTAEEGKKIIGVQANLWAEYITTFSHAQYMLLPRMAALAEVAWTPQADREYSNFLNRAKLLTQRYEALGYNFAKHILQEAKSNE